MRRAGGAAPGPLRVTQSRLRLRWGERSLQVVRRVARSSLSRPHLAFPECAWQGSANSWEPGGIQPPQWVLILCGSQEN